MAYYEFFLYIYFLIYDHVFIFDYHKGISHIPVIPHTFCQNVNKQVLQYLVIVTLHFLIST